MNTLGLDLGTNSIGWAVIDRGRENPVVAKGVQVFEKGVGEEKGSEYSKASERTQYRSARRIKQRRKLRKIQTLDVLRENDLCPGLTKSALHKWRYEKVYPENPEFRDWLNTKGTHKSEGEINPYYFRFLAVKSKLDLGNQQDRYLLGRAFFHLAQRRGYKSNRLAGEEKDGAVQGTIAKLDVAMAGRTLGEYFYEECLGKEEIRGTGHYTSRRQYEDEFNAICAKQLLPEKLRNDLFQAIFYQRPLRSQKGLIGKCVLESKKQRCPVSHPLFERWRALQFINNVRVCAPGETTMRPLTDEEREKVLRWNLGRKDQTTFKSMASQIVQGRPPKHYGTDTPAPESHGWAFNYREDAGVADCRTTARFIRFFGDNWEAEVETAFIKRDGKTPEQVINDIWHALFSFTDQEKLRVYCMENLGLTEEDAEAFSQPLRQGYGNVSVAAIRRMLPFLGKGMIYSHAVFMAKIPDIFSACNLDWKSHVESVENLVQHIIDTHPLEFAVEKVKNKTLQILLKQDPIKDFSIWLMNAGNKRSLQALVENEFKQSMGVREWNNLSSEEKELLPRRVIDCIETTFSLDLEPDKLPKPLTLKDRIISGLCENFHVPVPAFEKLYHPSAIETYPQVENSLGSPRLDSIKNPVFMRAMHRLRSVVNQLLEDGVIDKDTRVRVEMARDLTTGNERGGIYRYQREREKLHKIYEDAIRSAGFTPTKSNILKYQLWEEQNKTCIYTNDEIGLTEFLGDNPQYDIEHTIPRSRRLDDSQSNKTLCNRNFNRDVKGNSIPLELKNGEEICQRAEHLWFEKIEELQKSVNYARNKARKAPDKESKDKALVEFHHKRQELSYWRSKLRNFQVEEVPEGFSNSQLVDTRIISKYAVQYLKSYFDRVYSMRASGVSMLRSIWGVEEKFRNEHIHHTADAILVGSVSPAFYNTLADYFRQVERHDQGRASHPRTPEPWPGFAEYLNHGLRTDVLVVHHHQDLLLKPTFKKVRVRGAIQKNKDGETLYSQGDSARGPLHKETFYGQIQRPSEDPNEKPGELVCVVRKKLDANFKASDIKNIVDPYVRQKVEKNKDKIGTDDLIWFDEANQVPIKKVRVYVGNKPEAMIKVKAHRDLSRHEYKQHLLAANQSNYLTGLYRGMVKGKLKRDWKLVSLIEAVRAQKEGEWEEILPKIDGNGLKLDHVIKSDDLVLLYEHSPEELKTLPLQELSKRLYTVAVMEGIQTKLRHHLTSLTAGELKKGMVSSFDFTHEIPPKQIHPSVNKLNLLVEGTDFHLSPTGGITWEF
jgi:CRISPR-associated endonuclease Csn1